LADPGVMAGLFLSAVPRRHLPQSPMSTIQSAKMSRDSALVMFFYMRLEKHVCKAMSHDLLLALAVVSSDHRINFNTFV